MRRAGLFLLAFLSGGGVAPAQSPGAPPAPFPMPAARMPPVAPPGMQGAAPPFQPTPAALPASIPQAAQDLNPAPDPEQPLTENLVSFDSMSATLTWADRRWLLVAGGTTLKDFGHRDVEARQALRLIHDLRLNQRGTVGSPYPVMEYWLSDGQPPHGLAPGLRTLPVDPAGLRAEKVQGQWCLRDGQRILFNFGLRAEDARQALAVVRKYGFNEVGLIGQATPSMLLFLSRPNDFARPNVRPPSTRMARSAAQQKAGAGAPNQGAAAKLLARFPGAGMDSIVTPAIPPLRAVSHSARHPHPPFGAGLPHSPVPMGVLPGLDDLANRVPLDWRQVRLRQDNGWKLAAGDYVLADFGSDEQDAQLALAAMHYYRFTEHCRVGGPDSHLAYFLVNGQAPRGVMLGVSGVAFRPDSVTLQQSGPCWNLCSGNTVLMRLGERPAEEAKQLLEAVQRYQFDHVCRLGTSENRGMTFFVRSR